MNLTGRIRMSGVGGRFLPAVLLVCLAASLVGCSNTQKSSAVVNRPETFSFWPAFPAEPRIQFLIAYANSTDVAPPKSNLEELIYGRGETALPINKPYGVEMYEGRIYVCDLRNDGVIVLDIPKQEVRIMGTFGMGALTQPSDIAIASDGTMYVTDVYRSSIFVFDRNESHLRTYGFEGMKPTGAALYGDELFVCDLDTQLIHVFDRHTGDQLRTLGTPFDPESLAHERDGQFGQPLGIDIDQDGNIYVSDVLHCRITKFALDGTVLRVFGQRGDAYGTFTRPKHLGVDNDGFIYIVDAAFQNVQLFDPEFQVMTFFGSAGNHEGSMFLPAGLCVHEGDLDLFEPYVHPGFEPERLIIVTNQFGPYKVAVYAMGQLRAGFTADDLASSAAEVSEGVTEEGEERPGAIPDPDSGVMPTDPGSGVAPEPDAEAPEAGSGDR